MLKFSSKSDYALQVLALLASQNKRIPISLRQIAQEANLPYRYLSRIVSKLVKAGFLKAKEGVGGGYILAKKPADISLGEVMEVLEGPIGQVSCHHEKDDCASGFCACQELWQPLARDLEKKISQKTLKDIVEHA